MALPRTADRVPEHTDERVNQRIEADAQKRVAQLSANPANIARRIEELRAEWDIERVLETNASALAFVGTALGFFVHPYWLAVPAIVTAFLFQHALQGWCPPVPIFRRLGFRTSYEIEQERHALKALRGNYAGVDSASGDRAAWAFSAAGR
jgi:hypothetical protein